MIVMPGHDDELIKPPNREVSLRIDPKDILLFGEFVSLLMLYFLVHIFILFRSRERIVLTTSYDSVHLVGLMCGTEVQLLIKISETL